MAAGASAGVAPVCAVGGDAATRAVMVTAGEAFMDVAGAKHKAIAANANVTRVKCVIFPLIVVVLLALPEERVGEPAIQLS